MTRRSKNRPTGEEAWEQAFHAQDHTALLDHLGVDFSHDLLKLALTHRSFANEHGMLPNNERLEFLGDSVLGVTIADALYHGYPDRPESDISKMRAGIVSRYGLADIAREIQLGQYILLGQGESMSGGADKDSILADTTEAILGAIYLEHGFHVAQQVIRRLFGRKVATATEESIHSDWKTALQERVSELKLPTPVYESDCTGPDHEQHFTAQAIILGETLGRGEGTNKKIAEQQAARLALDVLQDSQSTIVVALMARAAETNKK